MEEIWKDIPDYEGLYQVSNYGNVKSLSRKVSNGINYKFSKGKIIKQLINSSHYLYVFLHKNKVRKKYKIHQLVAMSFLNHIPYGNILVVDHIDNSKLNNRLDNLQIITQRENVTKGKQARESKYVGVDFQKRTNNYRARIIIENKRIYLGCFANELEAGIAYQKALKMYNEGDFSFMKPKEYSSQYKGVSKSGNKWVAFIYANKKSINLGRFDTELEAHNEYLKQKALLL